MKKWNAPEIEMVNFSETACGGIIVSQEEKEEENLVSGAVITETLEENQQQSCNFVLMPPKPCKPFKPSRRRWFW